MESQQRQELVREPAPHTGVTVSSKQPSETPKKKGKEVSDQRTMQSRSKKSSADVNIVQARPNKEVTPVQKQSKAATAAAPKDTIFESSAYKISQAHTTLDGAKDSAVSVSNTRVALKPVDGPGSDTTIKPTGKTTLQAQSGKENLLPKPPDKGPVKSGVKLKQSILIKSFRPKAALGDGGWLLPSETMNRRLDPCLDLFKSEGSKHEKWDG